eukprot:gene53141-636_t
MGAVRTMCGSPVGDGQNDMGGGSPGQLSADIWTREQGGIVVTTLEDWNRRDVRLGARRKLDGWVVVDACRMRNGSFSDRCVEEVLDSDSSDRCVEEGLDSDSSDRCVEE